MTWASEFAVIHHGLPSASRLSHNPRILLVNPRYKPDWDLPGGMAEANESPLDAARREVKEELGIEWQGGRLLVVDWVPPHGPWDDSLTFVFDGDVLQAASLKQIRLADGELEETGMWEPEDAERVVRPHLGRRINSALAALRQATAVYVQCGGQWSNY